MKLLLLGILILFFIILITYEIYETFENKQPHAVSGFVRENITCSDPDMEYIYDRFDKAFIKKTGEACATNFTLSNYFGIEYCIPNCKSGYTPFSNDASFCVRTDGKCQLSKDLSNTIQNSWAQVCGPLYKTNVNILSTMGSISTVISTINNQYNTIGSNFISYSNTLQSYNGNDSTKQMLKRDVFDTIVLSNYLDLTTLKTTIQSNYIMMSNKKDRFDSIYNSFDCGNY